MPDLKVEHHLCLRRAAPTRTHQDSSLCSILKRLSRWWRRRRRSFPSQLAALVGCILSLFRILLRLIFIVRHQGQLFSFLKQFVFLPPGLLAVRIDADGFFSTLQPTRHKLDRVIILLSVFRFGVLDKDRAIWLLNALLIVIGHVNRALPILI